MPLRLNLTMWGSCTCYEFDSRICSICVSYFRMPLWRHVMAYFHSKPHWNWYWSNKKTTEILYQSDILSHNGTLMGWLGDAQIFHLQCSNIFGAEQIFVWCRIMSHVYSPRIVLSKINSDRVTWLWHGFWRRLWQGTLKLCSNLFDFTRFSDKSFD